MERTFDLVEVKSLINIQMHKYILPIRFSFDDILDLVDIF